MKDAVSSCISVQFIKLKRDFSNTRCESKGEKEIAYLLLQLEMEYFL